MIRDAGQKNRDSGDENAPEPSIVSLAAQDKREELCDREDVCTRRPLSLLLILFIGYAKNAHGLRNSTNLLTREA